MGTRASAGGEGNRGGDRAKSARDHAEGSGRAHPCGSTSPLWSCFVTHLCYEVPEHADEEHGEGDGDHHPVPHVGVEHPFFFLFRFEGTAGFVSDQHGGSSRRFGSGSRRERDRFRRRSQEIQPDPSGIVVVTYNMVAILVFPSPSSAPAAVGVADEVSSGGFRWHPPFEISPVQGSWRKTTRWRRFQLNKMKADGSGAVEEHKLSFTES